MSGATTITVAERREMNTILDFLKHCKSNFDNSSNWKNGIRAHAYICGDKIKRDSLISLSPDSFDFVIRTKPLCCYLLSLAGHVFLSNCFIDVRIPFSCNLTIYVFIVQDNWAESAYHSWDNRTKNSLFVEYLKKNPIRIAFERKKLKHRFLHIIYEIYF